MSNEWPDDRAESRASDLDAILGNKPNRWQRAPAPKLIQEPDWIDLTLISATNLPERNPEEVKVSRTAHFFATVIAIGIFTLSSLFVIGLIIMAIMWIASMF